LRLIVALCALRDHTLCGAAARGGALLLPIKLAQSGAAEQILLSLTAIHALAVGLLVPPAPSPNAADSGDECLLCSSGALQAASYVMRASDDASYLSLAASVFFLQCRHVPSPPLSPAHTPQPANLHLHFRAVTCD
jgi:hypothetical protein